MAGENYTHNRETFKKEIKKCILFDDSDRDFWLKETDTLPGIVIKHLLPKLTMANNKIDGFIDTALKADKEKQFLKKLQAITKKAKKQMIGELETTEKESAEQELIKSLDELNNL